MKQVKEEVKGCCIVCGSSEQGGAGFVPGTHGPICAGCVRAYYQNIPSQPGPGGWPRLPLERDHWISLVIVLATLLLGAAVLAMAWRLIAGIAHTVLLFALGALLAYALDPLVERIRVRRAGKRRRSRAQSVMFVLLGAGLVIAAAFAMLSATLVRQVNLLSAEHAQYEARARDGLAAADSWLDVHNVHVNLSGMLSHPPPSARTWGEAIAAGTVRALGAFSKDIVEGLLVVLIAVYFLLGTEEMGQRSREAMPDWARTHFTAWQKDVNRILGGFVRGQFALALTIGAMAAALCMALGLRLWLLIGFFVVVASLIPVAGPIIGVFPAIVAALLSPHAHLAPMVRVVVLLIAFVLINEFGSKVLYPRLVGTALGLHEVLVLFALLAGLEIGGIGGVLFAAPLTALAIATATQMFRLWEGHPPTPPRSAEPPALKP